MPVEDIELNVAGTSFKGVWIGVVLSFATTLGSGIWAASTFFGRLEAQESAVSASIAKADQIEQRFEDMREMNALRLQEMEKKLATMQTSLDTADITKLQGRLSELGALLETIMNQQESLLDLRSKIAEIEKTASESEIKVDAKIKSLEAIEESSKSISREIDDIWRALDAVTNPLSG